jgi:uncharacterized protein
MGRILFWVLLGVAVWIGWRLWHGKLREKIKRDAASARSAVEGEVLVQCRQCGVRLPKSSALTDGSEYFCSSQHRDEYIARQ